MQDGSTSAVCSQCASPLSESVALSAGVHQFTASSSEGLLGLGSQVKLRPSKPWLSDWRSGVCRLKGSSLDCLQLVICFDFAHLDSRTVLSASSSLGLVCRTSVQAP